MKKNVIFAFLTAATLLLASCGGNIDKNGWYTDFDEAKKVAQAKDKNILLFVNSVNDVPGSSVGVKTITESGEFTLDLEAEYVCVHFDFGDMYTVLQGVDENATSSEQKAAEKARNKMLKQFTYADMYSVQETPAIVLISKDGYQITSVSCEYTNNSAQGYAALVRSEAETVAEFVKKVEKTEKGTNKARIAAIDELYESASETQRLAMVDLSRELVKLDKKNESGLVTKHLFSIANAEAFELITKHDFEGAIKLYVKYATDKRIAPVDAQALYFMAASVCAKSGIAGVEKITELLELSIKAAPESESVVGIQFVMKNIKSMQEEAEAEKAAAEAAQTEEASNSAENADSSEANTASETSEAGE